MACDEPLVSPPSEAAILPKNLSVSSDSFLVNHMGLPCKLAGGNEERILQRYDALSTKSLSPVTKTFDHRMLLASTPLLGY